jgi:hypothetical protein
MLQQVAKGMLLPAKHINDRDSLIICYDTDMLRTSWKIVVSCMVVIYDQPSVITVYYGRPRTAALVYDEDIAG